MIIAFAGKMGSGKDTAASYLKEAGYTTIAFADNLKEMGMKIFGLTKSQCYDQSEKLKDLGINRITLSVGHISKIMTYAEQQNGFKINRETALKLYKLVDNNITLNTPRELLQYLGTEILRECIDADYHALVVKYKIDTLGLTKVAITDCRFPNERNYVKRWGGKTVLVKRPSENIETTSGLANHASENSLGNDNDYDYIIENDTTLAALRTNVINLIEGVKK